MGWFNKNKKVVSEKDSKIPELPKLPPLPKLPELPKLEISEDFESNLPALPKNNLGGEERGEEVFDEMKFEKQIDKFQDIQEPLEKFPKKIPHHEKIIHEEERIPLTFSEKPIKAGPVFIRLDKFEESQKIFKKAKEKIEEVEKILNHTKKIKEEEEKELESWENEINMIKQQLENIDKNIFSKIE